MDETTVIDLWPPARGDSPSPDQLRAAAKNAELTGGQAARQVRAHPRTWRKWVGDERACPWAAYFALLSQTGQLRQWHVGRESAGEAPLSERRVYFHPGSSVGLSVDRLRARIDEQDDAPPWEVEALEYLTGERRLADCRFTHGSPHERWIEVDNGEPRQALPNGVYKAIVEVGRTVRRTEEWQLRYSPAGWRDDSGKELVGPVTVVRVLGPPL